MKLSRGFGARRNPVTYLVPRTRFLARSAVVVVGLLMTTWCNGEGRVLVFQLSQQHYYTCLVIRSCEDLAILCRVVELVALRWLENIASSKSHKVRAVFDGHIFFPKLSHL